MLLYRTLWTLRLSWAGVAASVARAPTDATTASCKSFYNGRSFRRGIRSVFCSVTELITIVVIESNTPHVLSLNLSRRLTSNPNLSRL
ncbi:hypothetical protein F5Y08DRAFT_122615 [Xylaria arbuscula]|nr:hypothetical protein F5Y08DRAFT_122615 [Xylaria arbuscula]